MVHRTDYTVHQSGTPAAPDALRALPQAPAVLSGREEAVGELLKVLAPDGSRVAVVSGLAGVGKSALALTVAQQAMEKGWFEGGILFVELRGYAPNGTLGGSQAVSLLLGELGIRDEDIPPTPEGRLALYRSELATRAAEGRRVLIVADDAGEIGQVRDLVPAGDSHRLLVTSRDSLISPDFQARLVPLTELSAAAAAELVSGMLLRIRPDDPRPSREPDALAEITGHCGRLPLALTVAGALLASDPGLPLASLSHQLADAQHRLEALTYDDGRAMPTGVRAAFELSYARLPADQARLFRLLSVNPGPDCHITFVAVLYGESGAQAVALATEEHRMRGLLARLGGTGLIAEHPTGSGRWRMHDLVRLYAAELARRHAEEDGWHEAAERLILMYQVMLLGSDGLLQGRTGEEWSAHIPDAATALQWLDEERDNLIALVPFTASLGRPADVDGFSAHLQAYLHRRRLFQEAAELSRLSLAEAERSGDAGARDRALQNLALTFSKAGNTEEAAAFQERVPAPHPGETPRARAGRLLNLASFELGSGRADQAAAAAEESVRLFRDLGDRLSEGKAWSNLGTILQEQERSEEAVAAQERADAILSEAGDPHTAATVRRNLGRALSAAGRHEEAITAHEQAVAMFVELVEVHEVGMAFSGLAEALDRAGRARAAVEAHGKAVQCFRHTGDRQHEAYALVMHGLALAGRRDFEGAAPVHERACTLYEDLGDHSGAGWARMCLASALSQCGRADAARAALLRSASAYAEAGDEAKARLAALMLEGIRDRPNRRHARRAGRLLRRRGRRPTGPEEP